MEAYRFRQVELSERLQAVAGLVTPGRVVCDAGCDHGFVSIYLIQKKISPRVIAMDVNPGPLKQAKTHIAEYGLDTYIMTRLSDGVTELSEGEADCLILAGMGGRLMIRILTEGRDKIRQMKELILQPQSEPAAVRAFLRSEGYHIIEENMVCEEQKYYPMMKVTCVSEEREPISGSWQLVFDRYGEYLLKKKHPVLHQFLLWEQEREEQIYEQIMSLGEKRTWKHFDREKELKAGAVLRNMALSMF